MENDLGSSLFLHLDNSKFPLEMFDSQEFEEADKSPAEWVSSGCEASIAAYVEGKWKWIKCKVQRWDEVMKKYVVWIPEGSGGQKNGGREKHVKRLNILFDDEDREKWETRRKNAEDARESAKQRMRFNHFVNFSPHGPIAAKEMNPRLFEKIREKSTCIFSSKVPSRLQNSLDILLLEAVENHERAIKKSVLLRRFETDTESEEERRSLKLPSVPLDFSGVMQREKCVTPRYPYIEYCQAMKCLHYSNRPEVLRGLLLLYSIWWNNNEGGKSFSSECFFTTFTAGATSRSSTYPIKHPCTITEFCSVQERHCASLMNCLTLNWRKSFVESLVHSVQDLYDFYQPNIRVYHGSPLYRLLKQLEFHMMTQLRSLMLDSLETWLGFFEVEMGNGGYCCEGSFSNATFHEEMRDGVQEPLFHLRIHVNAPNELNGRTEQVMGVELHPSLTEVENCCVDIISNFLESGLSFTAIDSDVMALLNLPKRSLLDKASRNILVEEAGRAKQRIANHINVASQAALELTSRYEAFYYLMEADEGQLLESLNGVSDEEHFPCAQRFDDAGNAILHLSSDHEPLILFTVDTTFSKTVLSERAFSLRDSLLQAFSNRMKEENIRIIDEYEEILSQIRRKPSCEAELDELRRFMSGCMAVITNLMEQVDCIQSRLSKLDEFYFTLDEESMRLLWHALDFPALIDVAISQSKSRLQVDVEHMIEELKKEKNAFQEVLQNCKFNVAKVEEKSIYTQISHNTEFVNRAKHAVLEAKAQAQNFNRRERLLDLPITDYLVLKHLEKDIEPFFNLWNIAYEFSASKKEWLYGPFLELNGAHVDSDTSDWRKNSSILSKDLFEKGFSGPASCAEKLWGEISDFRESLPLVQVLASPALKPRHWQSLSKTIGSTNMDLDNELTLQGLLDSDIGHHVEFMNEVCAVAEKEYSLESILCSMREEWKTVELEIKPHKELGTFLLHNADGITALLDDHIIKTQTIQGNSYVKPIAQACKEWEMQLKDAQNLLDDWLSCQRTWLYLEPIFSSDDIMRQLPAEASRFKGVDAVWRFTMSGAHQNPNFMVQTNPTKKLDEKMKAANANLEEIQKGLSDYLETKRLHFPRFFFLSNDELIEILSQAREPRAVQAHLNKAFEGISSCHFTDDLKITHIISGEGEEVKLDTPVDTEASVYKGSVERWLKTLETAHWSTMRSLMQSSTVAYSITRHDEWCLQWQAQVILATSQVFWTQQVEEALREGGGQTLTKLVHHLTEKLRNITRRMCQDLGPLSRKTLSALCTIDIHARDVVTEMAAAEVHSLNDFEWVSQMRYYWEPSWKCEKAVKTNQDTLVVRIVNAQCLYGYEYLGNTTRLVITPLTDRCYRTMLGAIHLLYGGAPEGPAGTGKTETVKDLSKAVAVQCVVFNCSDGLDYLAMAKFFKGLAGCGTWCCFDEFNRINVEVLSVIAQQILSINNAKRSGLEKFHFEGNFMRIDHNANIFITMNPGYAGRTELPDNLKALFRPCAMMVPDYSLIAEIQLYSYGFEQARDNAKKLVHVLQLCSEQLSSQKHYDYGMRAVNSIVLAAGTLKQSLRKEKGSNPWTEARIVLQAINDITVPKFTTEDLSLFIGIANDLFPDVQLEPSDNDYLVDSIKLVCSEGVCVTPGRPKALLEPCLPWMRKVTQLYDMILVRHGVMLIGEAGSGKTAAIHTLSSALSRCGTSLLEEDNLRVHVHTLNPKAVTYSQLYGKFDENTHEWHDGILAVIFRLCAREPKIGGSEHSGMSANVTCRKWLVFDGPVDAIWIESMNTVLDDNKKLCLASGEIIKMSNTMTMVFEAENLEHASPATVSRVGMLFMELKHLEPHQLRESWFRRQQLQLTNESVGQGEEPQSVNNGSCGIIISKSIILRCAELLRELFDWLFPPLVSYVLQICTTLSHVTEQQLMASLIRVLESLLSESAADLEDFSPKKRSQAVDGIFVEALMWSLGVCTDGSSREQFSEYALMLMQGIGDIEEFEPHTIFCNKNPKWVPRPSPIHCPIQNSQGENSLIYGGLTLYNYRFQTRDCCWIPWEETLNPFIIPNGTPFHAIVVPTIDSVRHERYISLLVSHGHHVLCMGTTGTGKSVTVKMLLKEEVATAGFSSINLNFSARTSANSTQDAIVSKLDRRRKGVVGPPLGQRCIVFVDDISMPEKEKYGAQPPIELLRQWMDHSGWYDRKKNSFCQLVDIQFLAAMGPPGGGHKSVNQRYVRHFNLIHFPQFSDSVLCNIFGTIMNWFLEGGGLQQSLGGLQQQGEHSSSETPCFCRSVQAEGEKITSATIALYNRVSSHLLPTPCKLHYTFNMRDLSKVFQGILCGTPEVITGKVELVRLWVHECQRVFGDRLVSDTDHSWLQTTIADILRNTFNLDYNGCVVPIDRLQITSLPVSMLIHPPRPALDFFPRSQHLLCELGCI